MSNDATQQFAPTGGTLWIAPKSTSLPTDLTTPSGFFAVGFLTENGAQVDYQPAFRDQNAWQALLAIGKVKTGLTISITVELKQWNRNNLALAYGGGSWAGPSGGLYTYTPPASSAGPDYRAAVLDVTDGTYTRRYCYTNVIMDGQVQTKYVRTEDALLPLTFAVTPLNDSTPPFTKITDAPF